MTEPELPEGLEPYLLARANERMVRAVDMWAALTPRERSLVREAAVAGFYHGYAYVGPRDRESYPKDSAVVEMVLMTTDAMPDLYPTLSALATPVADSDPEEDE